MAPGDILYPKFDTRPLSVAIRGGTGWWDFGAGKYVMPGKPFDASRFTSLMYADTIFPTLKSIIIPAAARVDGSALLVPGVVQGGVFTPIDEAYWITLSAL